MVILLPVIELSTFSKEGWAQTKIVVLGRVRLVFNMGTCGSTIGFKKVPIVFL